VGNYDDAEWFHIEVMKHHPSIEVWNHPQFATTLNANQIVRYKDHTNLQLLKPESEDNFNPMSNNGENDNTPNYAPSSEENPLSIPAATTAENVSDETKAQIDAMQPEKDPVKVCLCVFFVVHLFLFVLL
jgi:hypothetical protein